MISLDAISGYHQVRVWKSNHENLVFFIPSGTKKPFKVIPFVPKNASVFYAAMMKSLRKELLILFVDTKDVIHFDTVPLTIICNDKLIIDYALLYSNHVPTFLHYFFVSLKCLPNIACL